MKVDVRHVDDVIIVDLEGRLVMGQTTVGAIDYDLAELKDGFYLVKVETEGGKVARRIFRH